MILVICGKSGAGKDYLTQELLKHYPKSFKRIARPVSRPIRDNEVDGDNYHFLTPNEFLTKVETNEIVLPKIFRGWYYGIFASDLSQENLTSPTYNILVADKGLALDLAKVIPGVITLEVVADDNVRVERGIAREENPDVEEIHRRLGTDAEDYKDLPDAHLTLDNNGDLDIDAVYSKIKNAFSKPVNTESQIKKGDLIKSALKDAPILKEEHIVQSLQNYVNEVIHAGENYILLLSREINYVQVFHIKNRNKRIVAGHLWDYLQDSYFMISPDQECGLVEPIHVEMSNIKEIKPTGYCEADMYVDTIPFKWLSGRYLVEEIL